jgi:hypothetical protein
MHTAVLSYNYTIIDCSILTVLAVVYYTSETVNFSFFKIEIKTQISEIE